MEVVLHAVILADFSRTVFGWSSFRWGEQIAVGLVELILGIMIMLPVLRVLGEQ
jgi:hypothetical protein